MDFAGYTYKLLSRATENEMKKAILQSIDNGFPLLAYNLANNDWCLLTGYDFDGDTVMGKYVPESWDSPERKPDSLEDDLLSKKKWFNNRITKYFIRTLMHSGSLPDENDL